ncbi:polyisoprenoid-binding protein YceI [Rhodococcus sp. SMB37]|uniref:YceI family protein n=1 Tax=Rhodococcus sp. SMB37 TaxID=2512213 RepID=UPI00104981A6|nr:YceI family protein [Rhodococcus sp. SMB37]TCN49083.1 polyisoprenoid-binding protein YceI [Rhodococcus sp. SMB37]
MRKIGWTIVAIVVVALLGFFVAPWVYGTFIAEDDAPAASVSTSGAQAATGELDGEWAVTPGADPNRTAAGYTVHEILRGADVTVVGSTDQVSGTATIADQSLIAADVTVQVDGIATDSSQRDGQFRGMVMDTANHPTATFTLTEPVDLSSLPTDGTLATVPATGVLTLRGEERPATVEVDVLRSGESIVASGSIPTTWSDWGIQPPNLGFVAVDEAGSVDFLITLEMG